MNTALHAQLSLLHRIEPSGHSVSNHPSPSEETGLVWLPGLPRGTAFQCAASRRTFVSVGLRHFLAGSPRRLAESSLRCPASAGLCYGLAVHLPLLSTSPRGDAVTFGYEVQTQLRQGLPPCWFDTLASALGWVSDPTRIKHLGSARRPDPHQTLRVGSETQPTAFTQP